MHYLKNNFKLKQDILLAKIYSQTPLLQCNNLFSVPQVTHFGYITGSENSVLKYRFVVQSKRVTFCARFYV